MPMANNAVRQPLPKQLTAAIKAASSIDRLAQLFNTHHALLNPIHIAAMITKLPKLEAQTQARSPGTGPDWLVSASQQGQGRQLLQQLLMRLKAQGCDEYSPRGVANIIWALAKLQCPPDVELRHMLLDNFCAQLASAVPQDISNVLWGVAKLTKERSSGSCTTAGVASGNLMSGGASTISTIPVGSLPSAEQPWAAGSSSGGPVVGLYGPLLQQEQVHLLLNHLCLQLQHASVQTISNSLWAVVVVQQEYCWCMCNCLQEVQILLRAFCQQPHDALPGHIQPVIRCMCQLGSACSNHAGAAWLSWQPPMLQRLVSYLFSQRTHMEQHHVSSVLRDIAQVVCLHTLLVKNSGSAAAAAVVGGREAAPACNSRHNSEAGSEGAAAGAGDLAADAGGGTSSSNVSPEVLATLAELAAMGGPHDQVSTVLVLNMLRDELEQMGLLAGVDQLCSLLPSAAGAPGIQPGQQRFGAAAAAAVAAGKGPWGLAGLAAELKASGFTVLGGSTGADLQSRGHLLSVWNSQQSSGEAGVQAYGTLGGSSTGRMPLTGVTGDLLSTPGGSVPETPGSAGLLVSEALMVSGSDGQLSSVSGGLGLGGDEGGGSASLDPSSHSRSSSDLGVAQQQGDRAAGVAGLAASSSGGSLSQQHTQLGAAAPSAAAVSIPANPLLVSAGDGREGSHSPALSTSPTEWAARHPCGSGEQSDVINSIIAVPSAQQLLQMFKEHRESADVVHLTAYITRLAKVLAHNKVATPPQAGSPTRAAEAAAAAGASSGEAGGESSSSSTFHQQEAAAAGQLVEQMGSRLLEVLPECSARSLSNMLWGYGRLRMPPEPELLSELIRAFQGKVADASCRDCAVVLWSLSRLAEASAPAAAAAGGTEGSGMGSSKAGEGQQGGLGVPLELLQALGDALLDHLVGYVMKLPAAAAAAGGGTGEEEEDVGAMSDGSRSRKSSLTGSVGGQGGSPAAAPLGESVGSEAAAGAGGGVGVMQGIAEAAGLLFVGGPGSPAGSNSRASPLPGTTSSGTAAADGGVSSSPGGKWQQQQQQQRPQHPSPRDISNSLMALARLGFKADELRSPSGIATWFQLQNEKEVVAGATARLEQRWKQQQESKVQEPGTADGAAEKGAVHTAAVPVPIPVPVPVSVEGSGTFDAVTAVGGDAGTVGSQQVGVAAEAESSGQKEGGSSSPAAVTTEPATACGGEKGLNLAAGDVSTLVDGLLSQSAAAKALDLQEASSALLLLGLARASALVQMLFQAKARHPGAAAAAGGGGAGGGLGEVQGGEGAHAGGKEGVGELGGEVGGGGVLLPAAAAVASAARQGSGGKLGALLGATGGSHQQLRAPRGPAYGQGWLGVPMVNRGIRAAAGAALPGITAANNSRVGEPSLQLLPALSSLQPLQPLPPKPLLQGSPPPPPQQQYQQQQGGFPPGIAPYQQQQRPPYRRPPGQGFQQGQYSRGPQQHQQNQRHQSPQLLQSYQLQPGGMGNVQMGGGFGGNSSYGQGGQFSSGMVQAQPPPPQAQQQQLFVQQQQQQPLQAKGQLVTQFQYVQQQQQQPPPPPPPQQQTVTIAQPQQQVGEQVRVMYLPQQGSGVTEYVVVSTPMGQQQVGGSGAGITGYMPVTSLQQQQAQVQQQQQQQQQFQLQQQQVQVQQQLQQLQLQQQQQQYMQVQQPQQQQQQVLDGVQGYTFVAAPTQQQELSQGYEEPPGLLSSVSLSSSNQQGLAAFPASYSSSSLTQAGLGGLQLTLDGQYIATGYDTSAVQAGSYIQMQQQAQQQQQQPQQQQQLLQSLGGQGQLLYTDSMATYQYPQYQQ